MPKLHDLCQICSEEFLDSLELLPAELRQLALEIGWSTMVLSLQESRTDSKVVIGHLKLTLQDLLVSDYHTSNLTLPQKASTTDRNPRDFYQIRVKCQELVSEYFPNDLYRS